MSGELGSGVCSGSGATFDLASPGRWAFPCLGFQPVAVQGALSCSPRIGGRGAIRLADRAHEVE